MDGGEGSFEEATAKEQTPDWPGGDKFVQVQDLLDKNVVLITQINENHSTRTPEALNRNVLLIRELNSNVQRIVELYKELSGVLTGAQAEAGTVAAAAAGTAASAGQRAS